MDHNWERGWCAIALGERMVEKSARGEGGGEERWGRGWWGRALGERVVRKRCEVYVR